MLMNYAAAQDSFRGLSEANLVLTAQKGDLEAFNQLVVLYQERIFNLALRILGDEDSADDIAQHTFLAAYRSLPGFRRGSFRGWLYRIATNACYDELRWRKKHPIQLLECEDGEEARLSPPSDFPNSSYLPEKEYERRELEQVIQRALNQLNADQRAVVVLVDLQGFGYEEAAQILGVSMGTLKSRLVRARLQLRYLLYFWDYKTAC